METLQASLKHEARVTMREVAGREERSLRVYQQGARRGSQGHVEPLVTRSGSQRQKIALDTSIILRDETVLWNMCGIDGHVDDETACPTVCAYTRDAPNTALSARKVHALVPSRGCDARGRPTLSIPLFQPPQPVQLPMPIGQILQNELEGGTATTRAPQCFKYGTRAQRNCR